MALCPYFLYAFALLASNFSSLGSSKTIRINLFFSTLQRYKYFLKLPNSGKFELFDISELLLLLAKYGRYASDCILLTLVHDLSVDLSSLDVSMPEEL